MGHLSRIDQFMTKVMSALEFQPILPCIPTCGIFFSFPGAAHRSGPRALDVGDDVDWLCGAWPRRSSRLAEKSPARRIRVSIPQNEKRRLGKRRFHPFPPAVLLDPLNIQLPRKTARRAAARVRYRSHRCSRGRPVALARRTERRMRRAATRAMRSR